MDNGQTTTRKDFFKKSGLAIAGVFALGKASSAAPTNPTVSGVNTALEQSVAELSARRLKPANGTVRYQS